MTLKQLLDKKLITGKVRLIIQLSKDDRGGRWGELEIEINRIWNRPITAKDIERWFNPALQYKINSISKSLASSYISKDVVPYYQDVKDKLEYLTLDNVLNSKILSIFPGYNEYIAIICFCNVNVATAELTFDDMEESQEEVPTDESFNESFFKNLTGVKLHE